YIHHREIAYSYAKLNNGELAKQHYERGFALCPASMEAERAEMAGNLGQMYLRQGDAKSAEYWINQAWLLAPKDSEIHQILSRLVKTDSIPENRAKPVALPTPHPDADPTRAFQLNLQYQEELAKWKALPMWKRMTAKKPLPPQGN